MAGEHVPVPAQGRVVEELCPLEDGEAVIKGVHGFSSPLASLVCSVCTGGAASVCLVSLVHALPACFSVLFLLHNRQKTPVYWTLLPVSGNLPAQCTESRYNYCSQKTPQS
jgi:hypothetical protein